MASQKNLLSQTVFMQSSAAFTKTTLAFRKKNKSSNRIIDYKDNIFHVFLKH